MTDAVGIALDDNACTFVVRDPRNMDYALINTRSLQIQQITEEQAQTAAEEQRDEIQSRTDGSPREEIIPE